MLKVTIPDIALTRAQLQSAFDDAYFNRFALRLPEINAVLVTVHTGVIGRRTGISLSSLMEERERQATPPAAQTGVRPVWFESGWVDTPIYAREKLPLSAQFHGPAVIEQMDTTIVVEPDDVVEVDDVGNLVISVPSAWKD